MKKWTKCLERSAVTVAWMMGVAGVAAAGATSAMMASGSAHADERIEKPGYWLSRGFVPVTYPARSRAPEVAPWPAHSLQWPAEFENVAASVGNSMAEFQWYGDDGPYFHGGCDVRVARAAPVRSPVEGRIEAGHYGYSNNPDGSMEKFWEPWPKSGSRVYFEIAVVTDEGYRFEFHHMDETKMSPEVLAILREGKGGRVKAGALLGATIPWPSGVYHHTHYNIISPTGVRLNPEHYSTAIADSSKPQVETVIAAFGGTGGTVSGKTKDFGDGHFDSAPNFFAVAVNDRTDGGQYVHPPVFAELKFAGGERFAWDFRERLEGPDGKFPPIWQFFVESIRSPGGQSFRTAGGFGDGLSVIRLPVPKGASGPFTITVADDAGNDVSFAGEIAPL